MPGKERDEFNDADTPISPVHVGGSTLDNEDLQSVSSSALSRSVIVAASIALFFVVLGVIFVLPKFVDQNASSIAPTSERQAEAADNERRAAAAPEPPPSEVPIEFRQASQELLAQLLKIVASLEQRNVNEWAREDFNAAREEITQGEKSYREQRYSSAQNIYQSAFDTLSDIDGRAAEVVSTAVADGFRYIVEGNSYAAEKSFTFALSVAANHVAATQGLERSKALDQVLALLNEAKGYEDIGDLDVALARYEEAYALDAAMPEIDKSIIRVKQALIENEYSGLMSEGIAALDNNRHIIAKRAFMKALRVKPQAAEATDALAQVENIILGQKIAEHLRNALSFETSEEWSKAGVQFRSAVKLDPELNGAKSGALRADRRLKLDQQLNAFISAPSRLADDGVHKEAKVILARARTVTDKGSRLTGQIERLTNVVRIARTPVSLTLLSDELTEVTLYKVGPLGSFKQHSVSIIPGRYVAVGKRIGFRDVRVEFDHSAGSTTGPITVQCNQKLAFGNAPG